MTYTVLIPARYASSRLPGKPLLELAGRPMIQWVYEAASRSHASAVYVATDHPDIHHCVEQFGGLSVLTSENHVSGTDRLQQAASLLSLKDEDCVVNVQGDEPLIPPQVIDQVADNLQRNNWAAMATLCEPIKSSDEYLDPNAVKATFDESGRALYFSRSPIPMLRDQDIRAGQSLPANLPAYRHLGLYAYRVSFLNQFVGWPEHPLEQAEKLEQLRALAHGAQIHIERSCATIPAGVDTDEDLQRVQAVLKASISQEKP